MNESSDPVRQAPNALDFVSRCLSIDLEVGRHDSRIHAFAAVRGDTNQSFAFDAGDLDAALERLDDFAAGSAFLLGHNIIGFDAKHLSAAGPELRLLRLPLVDTLLLNPLTSPRNPYHRLVKHYQDPALKRGRLNDPELDARLALELFRDQLATLQALTLTSPDLLLAWHWLTTGDASGSGFDALFAYVRNKPRPAAPEAVTTLEKLMSARGCSTNTKDVLLDAEKHGWDLAYALAWLSVAGTNSVIPPWVLHQYPGTAVIVKRLRDSACANLECEWCRERHDAQKELRRWFDFGTFRPEPKDANGRPLQQVIVEAAMRGDHILGILPTGTGKSVCYQVPALSRYEKTGALTVVISPLVALMSDQVAGLQRRLITSCAAINGLLSMPERALVREQVRMGEIGILLTSPEQLRNRSVRRVLAQREIGAWVIDEAHCISKWGHDFRPDYRYIGRVIRETARGGAVPPVMCLTATAKPDVVDDIREYFRETLGITLATFDGGARRTNLDFVVLPTTTLEKFAHIYQVIVADLPPETAGGAIVYCATRRQAEEVAEFLRASGLAAAHFHAGLPADTKRSVQESFVDGALRVIVATNAFGMGIDKPDVRLVVHADIPGSLENYIQEAGRAGRDMKAARCVLLYAKDDVERQFGMSARSRLSQAQIQAVLKSLRNLDRRKRMNGEVVATAGEILAEDMDGDFERDGLTDSTRVRTAVAWLEESKLLQRDENEVQIFPSSLRVRSLEEARQKLDKAHVDHGFRSRVLKVVEKLIAARADEGISTDDFGLNLEDVRRVLYDLERLGICSNDTAVTVFVHAGVERSSWKRFEETASLEKALIDLLEESAPDLEKGEGWPLRLRQASQQLKDAGYHTALPDKLRCIIRSLSMDGRGDGRNSGSVQLRRLDAETVEVTLGRKWSELRKTAALRQSGARRLLEHLLESLPSGTRGTDLLATTTLGKLHSTIDADLVIKAEVRNTVSLVDRALMWMHEQDVVRLNKGLAVFRSAMTIRLDEGKRSFVKADFEPLKLHYDEHTVQIHVMAEYAERGLRTMAEALQLAIDYFTATRNDFIQRWLPNREKEISLQTTPESWSAIVKSLNPAQQKIVVDEREQTNVLVLAGPGSGKTRVLVHRIAFLVRVRREDPKGILALAYNRHAAVEIRRRLFALIGEDARGVTVLTCHALAMRLVGASFADRAERGIEDRFTEVLKQAVALLKGDDLLPEEADEQRDRLLSGFRWILVDEYQDIGPEQYELISGLAGRTQQDEDLKLSLFAVGDDDQNIYEFAGASVEFIRRFESDYAAKPSFLTENYRSTFNVIAAANAVIERADNRLKAGLSLVIDTQRKRAPKGGDWETRDPLGKGRVQILPAGRDPMTQAVVVMSELLRLARLDDNWDWARAAVIAREWSYLHPVRAYCELHGIPVQMADEEMPSLWRLRETQQLLGWLRSRGSQLTDVAEIGLWLEKAGTGPWWSTLREAIEAYGLETSYENLPVGHFEDWLAEWGRDLRRRQTGLLLLTAHRAKGLEFDHVAVLDGGWRQSRDRGDADAQRRLYYVAMTRARKTLTLASLEGENPYLAGIRGEASIRYRGELDLRPSPPELAREYRKLKLTEVDLGFAGRWPADHDVHRTIAALNAGDMLELRQVGERCELMDYKGRRVGRLARAFSVPSGRMCVAARVAAILTRKRDDSTPEYRDRMLCDRWEVVLPELVFGPRK